MRRTFRELIVFVIASLAFGVLHAAGDAWPSKPITFVVPFPPGGITDNTSRLLAKLLSAQLGQSVVVDNRPGAGGSIGVESASRQPPDGYTIIYGTQGTHGANLALYKNVRYDPVTDFVPVHGMSETPLMLVINPSQQVLLFHFQHKGDALDGQSHWATPGGGLEPGESFEAAAVRELFEETGLTVAAVGASVAERSFPMMLPSGETVLSVGEGNGPVNALDKALRKDLGPYQSFINDLELVDYKVRILTGGTDAVTRVLIESRDGVGNRWFTIGVSPNIVDASFEALTDSIIYKLYRDKAAI